MNACASRCFRLSLLLVLPWLGSGCAAISSNFRAPEEITEKTRRLCEHGLLAWPDLARFPADMRPEDYVRPEDLAYLQAHPELPPPTAKQASQPPLCEVRSSTLQNDHAIVSVKLRPGTEADGPEGDFLVNFLETPVGWRLAYWLAEEATFPPQASAADVPLFSEAMTRPKKLSGDEVAYTREAIEKGVQGQMVVRCVITREGRVTDCHTLKPLPIMTQVALKALWGSRYTPATLDGEPLDVRYTFYFNLRTFIR